MKKIGILLVIAGLIIALIPVGGNIYNKIQQKKLLDEFRKQLDSQIVEESVNDNAIQDFADLDTIFKNENTQVTSETTESSISIESSSDTDSSIETLQTTQTTTQTTTIPTTTTTKITKQPKVIGTLEIKKLNIDVLVIEGVNDADLKVGVGHFPGTAKMGAEGNCAIAGHRSYTFGKYFNRLNELEIGDEILVSDGYDNFKYIVYKVYVVEPSDTYVLNQVVNNSILTLVTCEPIYTADHRLIVHAKLQK